MVTQHSQQFSEGRGALKAPVNSALKALLCGDRRTSITLWTGQISAEETSTSSSAASSTPTLVRMFPRTKALWPPLSSQQADLPHRASTPAFSCPQFRQAQGSLVQSWGCLVRWLVTALVTLVSSQSCPLVASPLNTW